MQRSPIRWVPALRCFTRNALISTLFMLALAGVALAQGNGKLQIHHIKVGQGDGMLLISPLGQTALFDDGVYTNCTEIKNYIQGLGISVVDYHFASHYHADHIGCIDDLAAIGITIGTAGYDRGYSYSSATYTNYVNTLGAKRTTIAKDQVVTLDAGAANPVTLKCVDLNGAGVYSPTGSDENAKSVVMKVSYGSFDEVIGGDLTGSVTQGNDVETTVGPEVGDVEVYKVHHHGSLYSTNDNWLDATTPEVAIIQVGNSNSYGHPTADALGRLHAHSVKTYWTETGAGATPDPLWDKVANGTIVVQADPGSSDSYTVSGPGFSDTYPNGGAPPPLQATEVAEGVTVLKGSITAGDYTRLAADDAVRMSVGAGVSGGKYYTDWYGFCFLDHPPLDLTVTYDGNFTVSRTQTLYLWNWTTSLWDQIDSGTVGTSDVTKTWSTSTPGNYVSASREVRFRVKGNNRNSSYTSRGDYMAFDYNYTQGTAPMLAGREAAVPMLGVSHQVRNDTEDENREALAGRLPLSLLRRVEATPTSRGAELLWTIAAGDHADGFNVYREGPDGGRMFVGNDATISIEGGEAVFRFADAVSRSGGAYWLGVRSCSGSEAMLGPITTEARGTPEGLSFSIAPNPARRVAHFRLAIPEAGHVGVDVFDVQGRLVATLFDRLAPAGTLELDWNLAGSSSRRSGPGLYFARVRAGGQTIYTRVTALED